MPTRQYRMLTSALGFERSEVVKGQDFIDKGADPAECVRRGYCEPVTVAELKAEAKAAEEPAAPAAAAPPKHGRGK
jgi:hypothetical protein